MYFNTVGYIFGLLFLGPINGFCQKLSSEAEKSEENPLENNLGQHDCCSLVWKPLTKTLSGSFIPSDAVIAGQDFYGRNLYFSKLLSNISTISESDTSVTVTYGWRSDVCTDPVSFQGEVQVLANPYSCKLEWRRLWNDLGDTRIMFNNLRYQIPIYFNQLFIRKNNKTPGRTMNPKPMPCYNVNRPLVWDLKTCSSLEFKGCNDIDVLTIDCQASLLDLVTFELYDIQVNSSDALFVEPLPEETIESVVLENMSNMTQTSRVQLTKSISRSAHFEEVSSRFTSDTSFTSHAVDVNFHVKASIGGLLKFLGMNLEAGIDTGYHYNQSLTSIIQTFTETGKMTAESVQTFKEYEHDIQLPPFSRTTFMVQTSPKRGKATFKSLYRITSPLELNHTLNALVRLGFEKTNVRIERDQLLVTRNGTLDVDSGANTYVKIESVSVKRL